MYPSDEGHETVASVYERFIEGSKTAYMIEARALLGSP